MNRREFIWGSACVSAFVGSTAEAEQIAYVGTANSIEVFRGGNVVQRHSSSKPFFLALHPNGRLLFAANDVEDYLGLPTGSVESYAIEPLTGKLTLINRQGLSLSATRPRHLAVSPDGRQLLVAAYGGGAYNMLPISAAGQLAPATQILKEIGSSAHLLLQASSHPHSVVFHPAGDFVIGTDTGSDRINIFHREEGELIRRHQFAVPAGSGPAGMEIHPSGSLLFILGEFNTMVTSYRFHGDTGYVHALSTMPQPETHSMAMHPSGRFLFAAGQALTAWKIDHNTGNLRHVDSIRMDVARPPMVSRDGQDIYILGTSAFYKLPFDAITGGFGRTLKLATLSAPISLALHSNA